ncbi:hypothetical protein RYX36_009637 [Vicia faba]
MDLSMKMINSTVERLPVSFAMRNRGRFRFWRRWAASDQGRKESTEGVVGFTVSRRLSMTERGGGRCVRQTNVQKGLLEYQELEKG